MVPLYPWYNSTPARWLSSLYQERLTRRWLLTLQDCQWEMVSKGYLTVDGRKPAPVDMVNIPLFTGFYAISSIIGSFF